MTAMLEMRNVSKSFAGVQALRDVNFSVHAGQIHALVGENGAGKSTLMKVLSGVYPAGSYEGTIVFEGEDIEVLELSIDDALAMIADGRIIDAKAIMLLQHVALRVFR